MTTKGSYVSVLQFLYRLSLSLWVGGIAMFTFAVTPVLFRTETRDTAARLVGNLFPVYFRWGIGCGVAALACLLLVRGSGYPLRGAILAVMLAVTLFQAFYVEPRAAALKREIGSFETTTREDPLRREFSRLHGISAACNLGVFGGGVVLLALL